MKYLALFILGFQLGAWCNSPLGAKCGYEAGRWTRTHILGLPAAADSRVALP